MRPFERPTTPKIKNVSYTSLAVALMNTIGGYCSFCEKVLNYAAYLFHRKEGIVDPKKKLSITDWSDLFLICGDCSDNMTNYNPEQDKNYLWPDDPEATKYLPFRYKLAREIPYKVVLNGTVVQEEIRSLIFVEVAEATETEPSQGMVDEESGTGDGKVREKATNTIQLFKLNGSYNNNPNDPQVVVPYTNYVNITDMRLEQRYEAYQRATEAAGRLQRAAATIPAIKRESIDNLLILINQTIESTGYISTWQTAIKANLSQEILSSIFAPKKAPLKPTDKGDRKRVYDELVKGLTKKEDDFFTKQKRRKLMNNNN